MDLGMGGLEGLRDWGMTSRGGTGLGEEAVQPPGGLGGGCAVPHICEGTPAGSVRLSWVLTRTRGASGSPWRESGGCTSREMEFVAVAPVKHLEIENALETLVIPSPGR